MSEQDQYGSLKSAEPIKIEQQGPYVVSTLNMQPSRAATQAYHDQIQKDLQTMRQRGQRVAVKQD